MPARLIGRSARGRVPCGSTAPTHANHQILRPKPATKSQLVAFHAPDYVDFLRAVTPDKQVCMARQHSLRRNERAT
jgi:hypothetical protein